MQKEVFKGSILFGPVPVALVTTIGENGEPNVFTVGWIGVACTKPPMLSIAIRRERASHANLMKHPECVVNLPTREMVQAVDFCGVRSAVQVDKIAHCKFELDPGVAVSVPSIQSCPIALECVVRSVTPLGTHDLFLVEVLKNKVDPALIDQDGKIHMEKGSPITYLHGTYYALGGKPIGSFGFSVARRKAAKEKVSQLLRPSGVNPGDKTKPKSKSKQKPKPKPKPKPKSMKGR